ncbi:MAG TPA: hypothetical protein VIC62_18575, partial [Nakamurella sp.]
MLVIDNRVAPSLADGEYGKRRTSPGTVAPTIPTMAPMNRPTILVTSRNASYATTSASTTASTHGAHGGGAVYQGVPAARR